MADEVVTLTVRGKTYEGWKSIRITRSLKAIAAGFSMSLTDSWSYQNAPWILIPGDECEVKTNGQTVIKGFIDQVDTSYSATDRTITVSGRERTGDLVDCSVDYRGNVQIAKIGLLELAEKLAKPFGVKVRNESGITKPIEDVAINPGDTVFQVLDKYSRQIGVLFSSDGKGTLLIQKVGQSSAQAQLIEGQNILSASSSYSMKDRFSEYRVCSQPFVEGLDAALAPAVIAKAMDDEVTRTRLMVMQAESVATPERANQRAKWEVMHRRGKSVGVSVKVQGWRLADGSLFEPNRLYKVKSPWIGIDSELLLEEMTLEVSLQGTLADLKLTRKDAYKPELPKDTKADLLRRLIRQGS